MAYIMSEQARASNRLRNQKFVASRPERRMVLQSRYRAAKLGVPHSITDTDVVIPDVCPILGITLVRGAGRVHDASPSLDRIVPSLGYVPGNIQVISTRANRIKNDGTPEELALVAEFLRRQS